MRKTIYILKNKYFISTTIFLLVLFIFEDTNVFRLNRMTNQLNNFKEKNKNQLEEIKNIKNKTIQLTTNKKSLEKFARETYYMKKNNEVVYLFINEADL